MFAQCIPTPDFMLFKFRLFLYRKFCVILHIHVAMQNFNTIYTVILSAFFQTKLWVQEFFIVKIKNITPVIVFIKLLSPSKTYIKHK